MQNRYQHVVENYGNRIHELVTEWYDGWLEGATSEAEVEKRLEGMVEEVVVGNVLIFGVGGWGGRGKGGAGEGINADFFLWVLIHLFSAFRGLVLDLTDGDVCRFTGCTSSPPPSSSSPSSSLPPRPP